MVDPQERVRELMKMLLELRLCSNPAEAEQRAKEIIASTDAEGPPLSAVATPAEEAAGEVEESAGVTEPTPLKAISTMEEMTKELAQLQPEPVDFAQEAPAAEEAPPELTVLPQTELEGVVSDLATLEEDEAKEEANEREIEEELERLRRELENSRKEVEMLRNKLTKTEDILAKAQESATTQRVPAAEARQPLPNHEKPRGSNPPIDLTKVFGRR